MQRRLVLIRHAQAAPAPVDLDRPLTARGAEQAAAIGRRLEQGALGPDRVVLSPALRTRRTWEAAAGELPTAPEPIVDQRIYDNTVDALFSVLHETAADCGTVALVGHNPAVGVLASILDDGTGSSAARRNLRAGFPPGGVAVFTLEIAFDALAPGTATLTDFTVPRA